MAERLLVQGNEAVGWGSLAADCQAFFGYPITPQNEIIEWFAKEFPKRGRVFLQSASETGSINMLQGGAATGARVMTSTSSPGWSLMQEGMSVLSFVELPCVIVDVQRTWMGTRHSQSDYTSAVQGGGYGGYKNIVLGPASIQEIHDMVQLAFYLADKYRNPVVVLSDAILGQMMESLELRTLEFGPLPEKDWALVGKGKDGKRHFAWGGSLSYTVYPHQLAFWEAYKKKVDQMKQNEVRYEVNQIDDAKLVLVAFGYAARVSLEAVRRARAKGLPVGLIRPISLWPFPSEVIRDKAVSGANFLVVEDNLGQMIEDVRSATEGRSNVNLVSCLDRHLPTEEGAIYPEKVMEYIEKLL